MGLKMEEHVAKFFGSAAITTIVVLIGNLGFNQGRGLVPALVIFGICLVVVYGGILILDDLDRVL